MRIPTAIKRRLLTGLSGTSPGGNPRRYSLCIFKLDSIGDFILALGAIRKLTEAVGEAETAFVINPAVASIAESEFPQATRICVPPFGASFFRQVIPAWWRYKKLLSAFHFDHLVCLRHHYSDYQELVLSWIAAKQTWHARPCVPLPPPSQFRTMPPRHMTNLASKKDTLVCNELESHAAVLRAFLGEEVSSGDLMPSFKTVSPRAGSAVILSPFGSKQIRDFPMNHLFAALHEVNARLPDATIQLTGSAGDFPRLALLFRTLRNSGVSNLEQPKQPSSLLDFIRAIGDARLVLTVETSTAHIAAALDKPTVALLGGGHFGEFAPWNKSARQLWLYNPLPCYGCDWDCIFTETRCLTEIPLRNVSRAVASALSR